MLISQLAKGVIQPLSLRKSPEGGPVSILLGLRLHICSTTGQRSIVGGGGRHIPHAFSGWLHGSPHWTSKDVGPRKLCHVYCIFKTS